MTYSTHLDDSLAFDDLLPIECEEIHLPVEPIAQLKCQQQNIKVLRSIWELNETAFDGAEQSGELAREVKRLDLKVDLILEMLGILLAQTIQLPTPTKIKITSSYLEWYSISQMELGKRLKIKCYFLSATPLPLTLLGEVNKVETLDGIYVIRIGLDLLSEAESNLLEKIIFRHHRREIANIRH